MIVLPETDDVVFVGGEESWSLYAWPVLGYDAAGRALIETRKGAAPVDGPGALIPRALLVKLAALSGFDLVNPEYAGVGRWYLNPDLLEAELGG
ncbi:hypothetical protein H181DRAFT_03154 [Streptomyces sp. WMMB 714]|uniref:hypothetical protein n=1 Tax=Streptomyces sp. WMMB 714 TaxID=1286822 RepID=UPI0005F83C22|nr:hypothetical protein [Streptomyces sp. WMMB 714]SCK37284.1 hypothetical protein H181DRAFT_03154 [Streptomyces sp. WMMB 714]